MYYPFADKTIKVRQAVEWIAGIAYPTIDLSNAKKRVLEKIRTKCELRANDEITNTRIFFEWATTEWPLLVAVAGVPRRAPEIAASSRQGQQSTISGRLIDIYLMPIPTTYDGLLALHKLALSDWQTLRHEHEKLKNENAELRQQLDTWRRKAEEAEKKKLAKNKSKGRRVKWD